MAFGGPEWHLSDLEVLFFRGFRETVPEGAGQNRRLNVGFPSRVQVSHGQTPL